MIFAILCGAFFACGVSDSPVTEPITVPATELFTDSAAEPVTEPAKKISRIRVRSFEQISMITGYTETLTEAYTAVIGDKNYDIAAGSLMGFPSTNDELCKAVNFGGGDLGIPIYDADNDVMYMVWGDTFSPHGHGDSSVWWDYSGNNGNTSRFWNNMTLARSKDTTYESLSDGFNISEFLTGTNVSGKALKDGTWADSVTVTGQIASPINRITETGDKETSKLSTGGLIIDGTIYLFYSSNGNGVSTMFHYSSCVKSSDGGKTWERLQDLTWNAFDLDDHATFDAAGNVTKRGVEDVLAYLDATGLPETVKGAGFNRIYTVDGKNTDIAIEKENGEEYLALRTSQEKNYRSVSIGLSKPMSKAAVYNVKVVFRPTEGFKLQGGKSKPLFLRFSDTLSATNDVNVTFNGLKPDENGWCTVEATLKSAVDTSTVRIFTYAALGEGIDIRSVTVTEADNGNTVLDFSVKGIEKAFNAHTAYHFTQFTPVQDKVGDGSYIYFYGQGSYREDDLYMARVHKTEFESFDAYEYFAGRNDDGTSIWTKNAAEAKPLVEFEKGASSICVAYNKGIDKWMLTYLGVGFGNRIRFADTIDGEYSEGYDLITRENVKDFINFKPLEGYPFTNYTKGTYNLYGAYVNSRWISEDGTSFYCILSQFHDCYNVSLVKVTLDVRYEE